MQDHFGEFREEIGSVVRSSLATHSIGTARGSESRIVPLLRSALSAAGYDASARYRLPGPIHLGRDPLTGELRQALSWAEADIQILRNGELVGVIECEHDLAWVVPHGAASPTSSAAWRYSMSSLASNADGIPFASYSPLERMAYIANWQGDATRTAGLLLEIKSADPRVHNPRGIPLFLVSEKADGRSGIVEPRLRSLGAVHFDTVNVSAH